MKIFNFALLLHLALYASVVGLSIDDVPQNTTDPWSPILLDLPLAAGASQQLHIAGIPATAQLVLVQAHVQRGTVSLEQAAADGSGPESVTGPHVGLVNRLTGGSSTATVTVTNEGLDRGTVLVVVTLLPNYTPIPGGCSQVEDVPDAPFFRVQTVHDAYSLFNVPRAQLGVDRGMGFTCDSARGSMEYYAYVMYPSYSLRDDYDTFKDAIASMLQPDDMEDNGYMVDSRDPLYPLRYTFALYRGYSVVYGAAVTGVPPGRAPATAAYVPAVLHGCPVFGGDDPECPPEIALYFYLTAALLFVSGALLLTVAARELSLHVVLTTALPVAALAVLVFRLLTWDEPNVTLAIGFVVGLLAGLVYARQHTVGGWSRGRMTLGTALLFGATLGAVILFVPDLQLMELSADAVFWPAFVLFTLAFTLIVLIPGLELCIVVTRSMLGSAWIMLSLAMLTGSVTIYIFSNLFRRAIYPEFKYANLQMRFLAQDYVCVSIFTLLLLVSLSLSLVALYRGGSAAGAPRPPAQPGRRARHWAERHRLLPDDRQHLLGGTYGATAPHSPPSA
ncbi:uncharacterized protein LOC122368102 [Amphibalanus amphitrite]|uniref:uncharacterized protein LOC122368102 n=1 Tax=Amphibalanus amphitrite TaxID=1232801 RepID=UPI001C91CE45|nr:uncharacterized protein LOC122368102 [Amphibalanus amphitrite]XP_043197679.1 uncharacterized protein LOC122368102 [Amphibalanus amphitrite]XP_043197680.1 uncharacterized protein LOC122368102 [Amphibalanus amphitrite]